MTYPIHYIKEKEIPKGILKIHSKKDGSGFLLIFPTAIYLLPTDFKKELKLIAGKYSESRFRNGSAKDARFYDLRDIFELENGDFLLSDFCCIRKLSANLEEVTTLVGNPIIYYDGIGPIPNGNFDDVLFIGPRQMVQHPTKKNSVLVVDMYDAEFAIIREIDLVNNIVRNAIGNPDGICGIMGGDAIDEAMIFFGGPMINTIKYGTIMIDFDMMATYDGTTYTFLSNGDCLDDIDESDDIDDFLPSNAKLQDFHFIRPTSIVEIDDHNILVVDHGKCIKSQLRLVNLQKKEVTTPILPENIFAKLIVNAGNGYIMMIASDKEYDSLDSDDEGQDNIYIIQGFVRNEKPAAKPTKRELEYALLGQPVPKYIREGPPQKKSRVRNTTKKQSDDDHLNDFSIKDVESLI